MLLQNSQGKNCDVVAFSIKFQAYSKFQIFPEHISVEHLWATVPETCIVLA